MTKNKEFIHIGRFIVASGVSAILTLALPEIFIRSMQLVPSAAVGISMAIAFVVNFINVKFFVFRSKKDWKSEFIHFLLSNGIIRLLEFFIFNAILLLSDYYYCIILAAVVLLSFVIKYLVFRIIFLQKNSSAPHG